MNLDPEHPVKASLRGKQFHKFRTPVERQELAVIFDSNQIGLELVVLYFRVAVTVAVTTYHGQRRESRD